MFAVMSMMLCLCITDMPSFQQCCTVYADDDYKPDGLTVGDSGDSVKWIQESLNIINNAGLEENGIFDENTEEAVKVIQGQHNMTQSGVATKATVELIRMMRSKAEKDMTTVTETISETETKISPTVTESENTENIDDEPLITHPHYPDPRNVPKKKNGHLFSGYWSEYFATLKSLIFNPKATLAPVSHVAKILFVLCAALVLFALFFSVPLPILRQYGSDPTDFDVVGCEPIIGKGCITGMLILIGILILFMPINSDIEYIRDYSDIGLGGAILLALLFTALRIALSLLVGGVIFVGIFAVFCKISENVAFILGIIPGGAVFLLFYFTPYIMLIWNEFKLPE